MLLPRPRNSYSLSAISPVLSMTMARTSTTTRLGSGSIAEAETPTQTRYNFATMTPELHLPEPLYDALKPLFDALPPDRAMDRLVVDNGRAATPDQVALVERIVQLPAIQDRPALAAGLWLYVDELDRSHSLSQSIDTPTGSFWHAIMHRREGDFSNSHYWYRRVGKHPAMNRISISGGSAGSGTTVGGYDPHAFVDRVERCVRNNPAKCAELVTMQRREWFALFEWCAEQ